MFKCTICGDILEPCECIVTHSEELCEEYFQCPYCRGECERYKEEENSKEYGKILLECMECGAIFYGQSGKYERNYSCPYCGSGCNDYSEDEQYYEEVILNVAHI